MALLEYYFLVIKALLEILMLELLQAHRNRGKFLLKLTFYQLKIILKRKRNSKNLQTTLISSQFKTSGNIPFDHFM